MSEKNDRVTRDAVTEQFNDHLEHRPRSRRKLLATIAVGGSSVVAGKSLSGEWSKPVIDSIVLPGHAQTSCILTCAVTGQARENFDDGDAVAPAPGGGWLPGSTVVLGGFDADTDSLELSGVTASVQSCAVTDAITVTITGNAQDDDDDGQGQGFVMESGTTETLAFDAGDVGGIFGGANSVDLQLTFSNPSTDDCVISFTFNAD